MTDDDLYLLHREELRLYQRYMAAVNGQTRLHSQNISDKEVQERRAEWLALHSKLRERLSPQERRRILQERGSKR